MENPLALPGQGAPPAYTLPRRACSEVRTISSTNPPTCIQNAMQRERKPFTYTPGGLDLSEIKSERMARRLMRNAMSPGVQETPVAAQTTTSSASANTVHMMNMPVQVFPAFQLPPNPRVLLRTRSTPYNRANSVDRALDFQQYNNGGTFQEDLSPLKVGKLPPLPKKENGDSGQRQNILRISESQEDVLNSDQEKNLCISATTDTDDIKSENNIKNENGHINISRKSSQSSLQNGHHSRESSIDKTIVQMDTNCEKRHSIDSTASEGKRDATPSSEYSENASEAASSKLVKRNSITSSIDEYEVTEVEDIESSQKNSRENTTTPLASVENGEKIVKRSPSGSSHSIRESTPRSEAGSESKALTKSGSEYSVYSERESTPKSETSAISRNVKTKYESERSVSTSQRNSISRSNSNVAATESIKKSSSFQSANSSRKNSLTRTESSVERKVVSISRTESASSVNQASSVHNGRSSRNSRTISVETEQKKETNISKHSTPARGSNETLTDKDKITLKTRKLSTPMRELQPNEDKSTGKESTAEDKPSAFKVDPSLKETLEKLEQNLTEMTKTFKESMSNGSQAENNKIMDVTTQQQTEVIRSSPEKPRHSLLLQRLSVEKTCVDKNREEDLRNIEQTLPYNVHTAVTTQTSYNKSLEYKDGKQSSASWSSGQNTAPDTIQSRPFSYVENPPTNVPESVEEDFETKNVKEHINVFNQTTEPPHWINTFKKNGAISSNPLYRPSNKFTDANAAQSPLQETWRNNIISQGEPPLYFSTDCSVVPPPPPQPPTQISLECSPMPFQSTAPPSQFEPEPSYPTTARFQSAPAPYKIESETYHSTPALFQSLPVTAQSQSATSPAPFQPPTPSFYNNTQTTQPAFYNSYDKGFSKVAPPKQEFTKPAYVSPQSNSFVHTYAPTHPIQQNYEPPFVQPQYKDNERHSFVSTESSQQSPYGSQKPVPFRPNFASSQKQEFPRQNFPAETSQYNSTVYYDDEIEPKEVIEPPWRRELREFSEKTSLPSSQTVEGEPIVEPPWMKEVKLRQNKNTRPMPHIYAPVPEPWSQTLRPKSWRERSVDIEQNRQNELPDWQKSNTCNKRPISAFIRTHLEAPLTDRIRGVSMDRDRFSSNYHSASSYTSSPSNGYSLPWESSPERSPMLSPTPLQYDRIRSAPQSRSSPFRQPASHVPQGYNQSSGSREYGTLSYQPRLRDDSRTCPVQSRSFKYLQRLTGTDDGYEDNEPFVPQPPMHSQPRPQRL